MHYTKYCKDLLNSCAVEQVIKQFSLCALYNLPLLFYLAAFIRITSIIFTIVFQPGKPTVETCLDTILLSLAMVW